MPFRCPGPAGQGKALIAGLNSDTHVTIYDGHTPSLVAHMIPAEEKQTRWDGDSNMQGVDIIFYGDSIFWEFNGDNLNGPPTKADLARRAIFENTFKEYSYEIMAIPGAAPLHTIFPCSSGDCTMDKPQGRGVI